MVKIFRPEIPNIVSDRRGGGIDREGGETHSRAPGSIRKSMFQGQIEANSLPPSPPLAENRSMRITLYQQHRQVHANLSAHILPFLCGLDHRAPTSQVIHRMSLEKFHARNTHFSSRVVSFTPADVTASQMRFYKAFYLFFFSKEAKTSNQFVLCHFYFSFFYRNASEQFFLFLFFTTRNTIFVTYISPR